MRRSISKVRSAYSSFHPEALECRLFMDSKVLGHVPLYHWIDGCAPTAAAQIFGYYTQEFPNLLPGPDVNDLIESPENKTSGDENQPTVIAGKHLGGGDWHNCPSFPDHMSHPNCIADFLKTENFATDAGYIPRGLVAYANYRGYGGWRVNMTMFSPDGFQEVVNSINQGRPLLANIDIDGSGTAAHETTVVGYNTDDNTYAAFDATVGQVRWHKWQAPVAGTPYGVERIYDIFAPIPPGGLGTAPGPYAGKPITVPGIVQAENFDNGGLFSGYHITGHGRYVDPLRQTPVGIEKTSDKKGGFDLGWNKQGDWLNYTVNVAKGGNYDITARVASDGAGGTFHFNIDGKIATESSFLPDTGGYQRWKTIDAGTMRLKAGKHVLELNIDANGTNDLAGNFNYFSLTPVSKAAVRTSKPFLGSPVTIGAKGGMIFTSNFDKGGQNVGFFTHDTVNRGGAYRDTPISISELNSGEGNGLSIGWTGPGDWLNYTVDVVKAGVFRLGIRAASVGLGGTFHVAIDGVNVTGALRVPDTGGWDRWQTVLANGLHLTSGKHVVRLVFDKGSVGTGFVGNFSALHFLK